MAFLQWRKFQFFDRVVVRDDEINELLCNTDTKITCSASSRNFILLGENNGFVHIISKKFKVSSFKANQVTTTHIKNVPRQPYFITCGSDQPGINPLIKIWNLDKLDRLNQPTCTRVIRANSGFLQPANVTCIECNESMSFMAVGYDDGQLVTFRGDISRQRSSKAAKPIRISRHSITGLALVVHNSEQQQQQQQNQQQSSSSISQQSRSQQLQGQTGDSQPGKSGGRNLSAFIATDEEIFYSVLSSSTSPFTNQIDTLGCQRRCCCLMGDAAKSAVDGLFAVGRKNAVYFYHTDGRGPCLAFDGEKLMIHRFKNYLVVISSDGVAAAKAAARAATSKVPKVFVSANHKEAQSRGGGAGVASGASGDGNLNADSHFTDDNALDRGPNEINAINDNDDDDDDDDHHRSKRFNLNIYDIKHKYAAYSGIVPRVSEIFSSDWGVLYVLTSTGQLLAFHEKDTQNKLETLFQKNQFGLAIDIAKSHLYNEDALVDIFKQYGDHLFKKGDYDAACDQYIKTIGRSETSHAIKMFLSGQCYQHLTLYLEALHAKSCAAPMHTTILLKCYTCLMDIERMEKFIDSYWTRLDVDCAASVLREAGFNEMATELEQRRELAAAASAYNGPITGENGKIANGGDNNDECKQRSQRRDTNASWCQAESSPILMLESNLRHWSQLAQDDPMKQVIGDKILTLLHTHWPLPLSPPLSCSSGASETPMPAAPRPNQANDKNAQLASLGNSGNNQSQTNDDSTGKDVNKTQQTNNHVERAMILCKWRQFDEGLLHLYACVGLYNLILDYYVQRNDSIKIMLTCEQFGQRDPNLYVTALVHYTRTGDERLTSVLDAIEHHRVIPASMVLKILADNQCPPKTDITKSADGLDQLDVNCATSNGTMTNDDNNTTTTTTSDNNKHTNTTSAIIQERKCIKLAAIKDYILRAMGRDRDKLMDDDRLIEQCEFDLEKVREQIDDIERRSRTFQPSKCAACGNQLELPSIHFLCGHSYDLSCFQSYTAENESECPLCVPANKKLMSFLVVLHKEITDLKCVEIDTSRRDRDQHRN